LFTKQIRGNAILVGLAPDRLGLRLNAGDRVEHRNRAVEHTQRALDLNGEVHMARGVNDVHAMVAPERGRRGGRNRDAALLLLLHPVHRGRTVVDLADLVGTAGVVQHTLGGRGLARIDMGHNADIAVLLDRCFATGHDWNLSFETALADYHR